MAKTKETKVQQVAEEKTTEAQLTPQQQLQLLVHSTLQQTTASLMQETYNFMHRLCDTVASKAILEALTDKQLSQILSKCDKELERRAKIHEKERAKRSKQK